MPPTRLPTLLALAAVALAAPARADDTADFLAPDNWVGRPDIFTVADGAVVGETTADPGHNTFLCSKRTYADFELSFKVRLRDGVGNSGVQVRSAVVDPAKFVVAGPQVDVGAGYFGALYGERVGGYLLKPEADPTAGRAADAHDYKVTVRGRHVTVVVNGRTTVDADFPDDGGKHPAPAAGVIAFQVHAGYPKMRVAYTDIRFRRLAAD